MKKMTTTLSALTIAAALMMNLTACTTDDNIADTPEQPTSTQGIHVTVGAGIGDDGTTRAAVTQEGTTRTLRFTEGDRLYIQGKPPTADNQKRLAGYVTIDPTSISPDGKSASFSGDLKVWDKDGNDVTSDFTFGDNQLDECSDVSARLIPKDAPDELLSLNKNHSVAGMNHTKSIATDVNTLMKTAIYVKGDYNGSTKSFTLSPYTAILNCTIGHLTASQEYSVTLIDAPTQSDYESSTIFTRAYEGTVTTDAQGIARFAIGTAVSNRYNVLKLKRNSTTWEYVLGQKDLDAKVYNVKKDNYALCNFIVQMPQVPGTTYYEQCDYFAVGYMNEYNTMIWITYTDNSIPTFTDGRTTYSRKMDPIGHVMMLYIKGVNKATNDTYIGTTEAVDLEEFGTYNFGTTTEPINLVKQ